MQTIPLKLVNGHLFLSIGDCDYLVDTGSPISFGHATSLNIDGLAHTLTDKFPGLTIASLSDFVNHPTAGLIGAEVLNAFDILINVKAGTMTFAAEALEMEGDTIDLDSVMDIPVIDVCIDGAVHRMFFDSGAQISYFQDDSLDHKPPMGAVTDFYPGVGQFETATHLVDVSIGNTNFQLRCGRLPGLLGLTLMIAGVTGIVGNSILYDRKVGYFPRKRQLVLG